MLRKTNDVRTIVCIKLRLPLEFKREDISCGNKNLRGHCERCLNWELFFHIHRLFIYFFFPHGIWKGLTWSISHIPQTIFFSLSYILYLVRFACVRFKFQWGSKRTKSIVHWDHVFSTKCILFSICQKRYLFKM